MSKPPVAVTEEEHKNRGFIDIHCDQYLDTGGAEGHIMDMTSVGGLKNTPTLLLKTVGRKTGTVRYSPLIYGFIGADVILMATRGGADIHPGWYLNLVAHKDAYFQIATQAFRATWRVAAPAERPTIWPLMESLFPLAKQYQKMTTREIPLVLLTAQEQVPVFKK